MLDPELTKEPPEDLEAAMENEGFEHVATIDTTSTCLLIGTTTIAAGAAISLTGIGAPAGGVLMQVGTAMDFACVAITGLKEYQRDTNSYSYKYLYIFKNENIPETINGRECDELVSIQTPCR